MIGLYTKQSEYRFTPGDVVVVGLSWGRQWGGSSLPGPGSGVHSGAGG